MTRDQKAICRALIEQSYESGFDGSYPVAPIAAKLGITDVLFDSNTEAGILWKLNDDGFLNVSDRHREVYASVSRDTLELLEHWSREDRDDVDVQPEPTHDPNADPQPAPDWEKLARELAEDLNGWRALFKEGVAPSIHSSTIELLSRFDQAAKGGK